MKEYKEEFKQGQARKSFKKKHNIKRLTFQTFERIIDIELSKKGFWYVGTYAYMNYDLRVTKLDSEGKETHIHTYHETIDDLLETYYFELNL